MKNPDIRWKQRFYNFKKAFSQFEKGVNLALKRDLSELEDQGLIKAFEFTHELAWKMLKDFLESRGNKDIYGSKDAIRESFRLGLVNDGEIWMEMIENRNQTVHTYNLEVAKKIVNAIVQKYYEQFDLLRKKFMELEEL
jgi:nucleotidyltransferase substrate binding protein (TIGR01987 family)